MALEASRPTLWALSKGIGGVTTDPVGVSHPDSGRGWLMHSCPVAPTRALDPRGPGAGGTRLALQSPAHVLPRARPSAAAVLLVRDTVMSARGHGFPPWVCASATTSFLPLTEGCRVDWILSPAAERDPAGEVSGTVDTLQGPPLPPPAPVQLRLSLTGQTQT